MAFFQMNFRAESLNQDACVNVIIPSKMTCTKFKTLWLLHGLSGNQDSWMRYSSIERYARDYGIAVVMPSVDRSWYTDTAYGKNYFTYVTKELPEKIAYYFGGYSNKREDNIVIGLSMGGYGALKMALTYPENYSFCASLSGSLDITRKNRPCNIDEWRSIFGFDLKAPAELEGTKHDMFVIAENTNTPPYIYMWCGTEDILIEVNKRFSAHLNELGIAHTFKTSEGNHSWKYWDMHIQNALDCWKEGTWE